MDRAWAANGEACRSQSSLRASIICTYGTCLGSKECPVRRDLSAFVREIRGCLSVEKCELHFTSVDVAVIIRVITKVRVL